MTYKTKHRPLIKPASYFLVLAAALAATPQLRAGTAIWTAGSGTDILWSDGANWSGGTGPSGVPASTDDVKFFNTGGTATVGVIDNTVDNLFGGTIASLQYGNTNNFHTTQLSTNLNITGAGGLVMYTPADPGAAKLTNVIKGAGVTLNINNTTANLSVNQGSATTGSLAALDMSGLDTFTGNIARLGLGSSAMPNNAGGTYMGVLYLAKTNNITLSQVATLAAYSGTPGAANSQNTAIDISHNTGNPPKSLSILYLGESNQINVDSIRCAGDKASSPTSAGLILFNPTFTNNINTPPSAVFRGTNGANRVTWWTIGDMGAGASGSNSSVGTNDFSNGYLDALIETLSLGRDSAAAENSATPILGVLTYNTGVINVNTVYAGNQILNNGTIGTCSIGGIINVNGTATMLVNSNLVLGRTSILAPKVTGALNINGGSVYANAISVGATSTTNTIRMTNATLVVTNSLATNASGLFVLAMTNSTLGLTVPAVNGTPVALTQTLVTGGAANSIQLATNILFFSSYPQQIPLIKYTTWTNVNNFGLINLPGWAPGATLVSNGPNKSLDLLLPSDPRPVIVGQPSPYSGSPGDTISTNFTVTISAGSVTPLGYQWYYANGGVTNALSGTTGPSGVSTISVSTNDVFTIADAQPADSGSYFVVISNVYGSVTSAPALLTISAGAIGPALTGPVNVTVIQGNNATFTASVSGSPIPSLQWLDNNLNPIPGATTSSLTLTNVQFAQNGFSYTLTASNSAGTASSNAFLTVIVPPVIVSQPQSLVVTNTFGASFTVSATGVPSPSFQWLKNNVPITTNATATTANLVIASTSPSDTASYSVQVFNTAGTTNSIPVTLTVNSSMSAIAFAPSNGATGICYDTPLYITFNQPPVENTMGKIRIFNSTNSTTPVDTLDLSLGSAGVQARSPFPGDSQAFNYYPVIITGNTAAIYPHSGVMTSNQTYYVTIDDGAFTDASGAFFAGISSSTVWEFTTKPTGPVNATNLVVAIDGTGDFVTVQGAVDFIPLNNVNPTLINVHNGNYVEIVDIASKPHVLFRGQSRNGTLVGYANNANIAPGGTTHARMAFKINSTDISVDNITITNRTPVGGSQAEAIMIESGASRFIVNNATVGSYQDTFLANVNTSQAYVYNSLIQGQFDYVWGGGNLFFTNCELRTLIGNNGTLTGGNLTAARTDNGVTGNWPGFNGLLVSNGISFVKCQMTRLTNTITATTLADANGSENGLVAWIDCSFDANYITPTAAVTNSQLLWEFGNSNLLNTAPVTFGLVALTNGDPRLLAAENSTIWLNGWMPQLSPNIIGQPSPLTVNAGQSASFTVAATGIPDPTYQWQINGNNVGSGGTSATFTVPSPQAGDAGQYQVIVSNASGSVTSQVASLTVNLPPVPGLTSLGDVENTPASISLAKIVAAASDPQGEAFSVTGVSALSTNDGTVTLDSTSVTYTPPLNFVGGDQFSYTLTDSSGASSVAIVNVAVVSTNAPSQNQVGSVQFVGSNAQVTFAGIPTYTYHIQRSASLVTPNWTTIGQATAGSNGQIVFTDTNPPEGQAFYRTIYP